MTSERLKLIEYIEKIGFKSNEGHKHMYDGSVFEFANYYYNFWNGSEWFVMISYTDYKHINDRFKKELRSLKLKKILKNAKK